MINVRPPPPRYSPENVEIKVTTKHLFPRSAEAVDTCCMHIPAHDDDDDNDDDDDDDDDDDLYIIGAVRPSVCPSVTKVIISATVAGEIYI